MQCKFANTNVNITHDVAALRPTSPRRIALHLDRSMGYTRGILRGVYCHAAGRDDWHFAAEDSKEPVHGRLGFFKHADLSRFRRKRERVVQVSDHIDDAGIARVLVDNHAVGRCAADYLLGCGCRGFVFYGAMRHRVAQRRYAGFQERLREEGVDCGRPLDVQQNRRVAPQTVTRRLSDLPGPIGVMCFTDGAAVDAAHSVQRAGFTIPDDVALVGVDNDDLLCRMVRPELSSVALPLEELGRRACEVLDAILDGNKPLDCSMELAPLGVVERGSTRVERYRDPLVDQAMAYMRGHAHEPIDVSDVVAQVPACRRSLEYRFAEVLGRTPHNELQRMRCQRAMNLILGSALSLEEIAHRCGFSSPSYFSQVFRKVAGETPSSYRRRRGDPV